jgi:hypothetical protein
MYQEYLMQVRHEDRLRTAAKDQLAAQARRARGARRGDTGLGPARRLTRAMQSLAGRVAAARRPDLSPAQDEHEQLTPGHIHLTATAMAAPTQRAWQGKERLRAADDRRPVHSLQQGLNGSATATGNPEAGNDHRRLP